MSLVFFDEIMNILPYHFDDSSKRGWLIVKDQWPEKHGAFSKCLKAFKTCCVSFLCDIVNQHPYLSEDGLEFNYNVSICIDNRVFDFWKEANDDWNSYLTPIQ